MNQRKHNFAQLYCTISCNIILKVLNIGIEQKNKNCIIIFLNSEKKIYPLTFHQKIQIQFVKIQTILNNSF